MQVKNSDYQKVRMKQNLLNYAENLILKRRNRIRDKHIETLYRNWDEKNDYRTKSEFFDSEIETNILWFRSSILKFTDIAKKYEIDYMALKKVLRYNQQKELEIALAK